MFNYSYLCELCDISSDGTSIYNIQQAAITLGFKTMVATVEVANLEYLITPFIVHWKARHFIVVVSITSTLIGVIDPTHGYINHPIGVFSRHFSTSLFSPHEGVILLLEPM